MNNPFKNAAIVAKIKSKDAEVTTKIKCEHCGGSGSIDEEDSMFGSVRTCPWCKGTGQVNVIDLDSYLVTQIIELGELLSKARKEMNY